MIVLFNKTIGKKLSVPTKLEELSFEYIKSITEDILVADNHALIALIVKAPLNKVASKDDSIMAATQPILIKRGTLINTCAVGEENNAVIISPTSIVNGYHVTTKRNDICRRSISSFVMADDDLKFAISGNYRSVSAGACLAVLNSENKGGMHMGIVDINNLGAKPIRKLNTEHLTEVYYVEFKIVPAFDIVGAYKNEVLPITFTGGNNYITSI